jgi:hypothetical protein
MELDNDTDTSNTTSPNDVVEKWEKENEMSDYERKQYDKEYAEEYYLEDDESEFELEILIALEMWFYSVFWIGIFGLFVWLELPLNIIAMLIHPASKPQPEWDEEGNEIEREDPGVVEATF